MLKPPITLLIARSRQACWLYGVLALSLALMAGWVMGVWAGLATGVIGAAMLWRTYYAQPVGTLQLTDNGSQRISGRWLLATGELGQEQSFHCDYLGPWLVGVRLGAQRLWLWPDSLPSPSQRALRRLCHRPGR